MDFSHLKKLDVVDKTARFTIAQMASEPVLIMKPGTEANKLYFNAILKRSRSSMAAIRRGTVTERQIAESREKDRQLFPKFVVVGWENVTDREGNQVPFTPDNCEQFLRALPDWIFDDIRNFAADNANFFGEPIDIEETAKNFASD
jgi:hypothetical protein